MLVGPDYNSDEEGFSDDPDYEDFRRSVRERNVAVATQNKPSEVDTLKSRTLNVYTTITFGRNYQTVIDEFEKGFDINADLQNGWTPLLLAASFGNEPIVQELIRRGVDVNQSREGNTALLCACNSKIEEPANNKSSLGVIRLLLNNGADPKAVDNKRRTPLMAAACTGQLEAVKLLLPMNDKEAVDNQKWTALFWAVDGNAVEVVKFLINEGFETELVDVRGQSLINLAQMNGDEEVIDLLLPIDCGEILYLYMNSNVEIFENIFDNLKNDEKPRLFNDICKILYGSRGESVATLIDEKGIPLFDLLSTNDEKLKEIGVLMPYQRKRILSGLYQFHKHPFHPKSLPMVPKKEIFSNQDFACNVLTCVKQVISMEAGLKFIQNNVENRLNLNEKRELITSVVKLKRQIKNLKKLSNELVAKAEFWDSTLSPADLIMKKRRNIPWSYVFLTVSLSSLFITYKLIKKY